MRRTAITLATATLAISLTACSSSDDTITTKPGKTATSSAKATAAETTKAAVAGIGDTITLKGMDDGQQLDYTIKKIADPATSSEEGFEADDSNRWVGVQLLIVNTGKKTYSDTPDNGAQIADTDGQRFGAVFAEITAGPSMTSNLNLPVGEKALGWVTFEVPKDSNVASVQFGMDSGFADQTGQWTLK